MAINVEQHPFGDAGAGNRQKSGLEREGVILGYRALNDRHKLGLSVRAYCGVVRDTNVGWEKLAHDLAKIEGVVSVFTVSGEVDLMLEIVAQDMLHYSQVVMRDVINAKGVSVTRSSFVLAEVKSIYEVLLSNPINLYAKQGIDMLT